MYRLRGGNKYYVSTGKDVQLYRQSQQVAKDTTEIKLNYPE
jgi:hypothetical protein